MTEYRVNSGHVIMRQNDHGDKFMVETPSHIYAESHKCVI
jgi:hypothetical protein